MSAPTAAPAIGQRGRGPTRLIMSGRVLGTVGLHVYSVHGKEADEQHAAQRQFGSSAAIELVRCGKWAETKT